MKIHIACIGPAGETTLSVKLSISKIEKITDRVKLFSLVAADGGALPRYEAGAHLDFDLGEAGTRSYSLIDFQPNEAEPLRYQIAVQREEDGKGGSKAMHGKSVSDVLSASTPKNDFSLVAGNAPVLLIAGGIGVTPIISFATKLKNDGVNFDFNYAVQSARVCAFHGQLSGQFEGQISVWFDDANPIDLKALVEDAHKSSQIYCCGPRGMIEAVRELADAAGFPSEQIHFELFATPAGNDDNQPFEVEISDSGQVFTIPADKTIIEVLEEQGLDVMYDCQRGDCGICQTDVVSGEPDHRDVVLSESERASGKVMQICVSRAKSARLVLDL